MKKEFWKDLIFYWEVCSLTSFWGVIIIIIVLMLV